MTHRSGRATARVRAHESSKSSPMSVSMIIGSGAAAAAQVARARRAAVQDFQATKLVVHCGVHVWRSVLTHGVCAHHIGGASRLKSTGVSGVCDARGRSVLHTRPVFSSTRNVLFAVAVAHSVMISRLLGGQRRHESELKQFGDDWQVPGVVESMGRSQLKHTVDRRPRSQVMRADKCELCRRRNRTDISHLQLRWARELRCWAR